MRVIGENYDHMHHLSNETLLLVIEGEQPSLDDEVDDEHLPNPIYWEEIEDVDKRAIEKDLTQFGVAYMIYNNRHVTLRVSI